MAFNLPGLEKQFDEMAHALGVSGGHKTVVPYLLSLNEKLGIPTKLRGIGVKEEHLEPLAQLAINDFCHPSNPKPVSLDDFRTLYKQAL
jgi:alcohol dehydrogenase class IV